jgi:hypothetical protein
MAKTGEDKEEVEKARRQGSQAYFAWRQHQRDEAYPTWAEAYEEAR